MRLIPLLVALAIAAVAPVPAAAQSGAVVVGKGPGVAGAAQTVKVSATITAIDAATRTVTLRGPQGRELSVTAGPEVKNFAQMKVGDKVDVEYVEALTLELRKGGGQAVAKTEVAGVASAKPGAAPGAVAGRQVKIVADVVAVDTAAQVVTLKGPQRTVELKVRDPKQLAMIAKGDQVEATFTEAVAIAVSPSK
jgi:hypothetical protein